MGVPEVSYRPVVAGLLVVDCDICRESLEDGDWVQRFTTQDDADNAAAAAGWTHTAEGTVCPRENLPHRQARSGQAA
jgi:hypothetical protein